MKQLILLFQLDFLALRRWFTTYTFTKLVVILGFGAVLVGLILFTFVSAQIFFTLLSTYASFGRLTADYVLSAVLLTLTYFAIGSAIIGSITFLMSRPKYFDHLISLPVSAKTLAYFLFIKSTAVSFLLLTMFLTPIVLAYGRAFGGANLSLVAQLGSVLVMLTVTTSSLASLISFSFLTKFKQISFWGKLTLVCVFFLSLLLLWRMMFPPTLTTLYEAEPHEFETIYQTLPLTQNYLPTRWFADTLTYGFSLSTLYACLLILILTTSVLEFDSRTFLPLMTSIGSVYPRVIFKSQIGPRSRAALIKKDLLSILRSPQEAGYGIFLLSLVGFFFLLLTQPRITYLTELGFSHELILFAALWFFFFTTAYLLRLVFPLMAKEGPTAWFLFTQPLKSEYIAYTKLVVGIILVVPFLVGSLLIWSVVPFTQDRYVSLISMSWVVLMFLTLGQSLISFISPPFSLASDPEKISTSPTGLLALFYSLTLAGGFGFGIYQSLKNAAPLYLILILGIAAGSITILFFFLAPILKRYEF